MGGRELGLRDSTLRELTATATVSDDEVLGFPSSYMLGFSRPNPTSTFGSSSRSFGTPGAGGSFGFADPDRGIGYAYVMTRMDYYACDDPRDLRPREALYRCIARLEQRSERP
jgi:CubicO group peptidase (beta-lactamase class C family)